MADQWILFKWSVLTDWHMCLLYHRSTLCSIEANVLARYCEVALHVIIKTLFLSSDESITSRDERGPERGRVFLPYNPDSVIPHRRPTFQHAKTRLFLWVIQAVPWCVLIENWALCGFRYNVIYMSSIFRFKFRYSSQQRRDVQFSFDQDVLDSESQSNR